MRERLPEAASRTVLSLPFAGRWLARNSPARRVPSHGTDLLGERFAIDFIGVDFIGADFNGAGKNHHTANRRDWHTFFGTEPVDRFFAFGRPILAPVDGTVIAAHDGESDHEARRSQLALVPYVLGQAARLRQGVQAIAGNHLVIALHDEQLFVALVHLRAGSLRVGIGDRVVTGTPIAECGNSGNSTQPHLHLQVMDSADLSVARGTPLAFRDYREWTRGSRHPLDHRSGIPAEDAVVESLR